MILKQHWIFDQRVSNDEQMATSIRFYTVLHMARNEIIATYQQVHKCNIYIKQCNNTMHANNNNNVHANNINWLIGRIKQIL